MPCQICNTSINVLGGPSTYTFIQQKSGGAWWIVHRTCLKEHEAVGAENALTDESVEGVI
jgi:hypothetical protein